MNKKLEMFPSLRKSFWAWACASGLTALCGAKARATTVTANGGLSVGRDSGINDIRSPTPILGAEYYLDLNPHLQAGVFYDLGFPKDETGRTGLLQFAGITARLFLNPSTESGPFVAGRAGLATVSDGGFTTDHKLGFATGVGYQVKVSRVVSLAPQVGVRFLPNEASGDLQDHAAPYVEMGVSFHF
jgi:hypothetical protein